MPFHPLLKKSSSIFTLPAVENENAAAAVKNSAANFAKIVARFDVNKNGGLTKDTFIEMLKTLEYPGSDSKMESLFDSLIEQANARMRDLNQNFEKTIDGGKNEEIFGVDSLLRLYGKHSYEISQKSTFDHTQVLIDRIRNIFKKYDVDGNLYLDPEETRAMLHEAADIFGESDHSELSEMVDTHGYADKGVHFWEFMISILRQKGFENLEVKMQEWNTFSKDVKQHPSKFMPHKIRWDNLKAKEDLVLKMPWDVREELTKVTNGLAALDVTADNFELGQHGVAIWEKLRRTIKFANKARHMIIKSDGACLVRGLDLDAFKCDETRKLAYFIFNSCMGQVDGEARGRLFDVKDKGKNPNQDNVLFSVSNVEATWHTDGASIDRVNNI